MSKTFTSTPRADGFRMPGEFEPQDGCWMLWPERPDNWRLGGKPAQRAFVNVATAINQFEPVTMGVSHAQFTNARNMLPDEVRVVEMSNNDSWMRDCGPTFVTNGKVARIIDWDFNAWGGLLGGLYFPWDLDDMVARKVGEIERVDRYKAPIVLEGGSIHTDGQGTLLTTEECLLNGNRNPQLSKEEIEAVLKDYLGIDKIIWLSKGVYNDETNGHVDNICCFIRPGEVLLTWTDDKSDPQYEISMDAYERLSRATDARGRKLQVHKIYQPGPIHITEEESLGVDAIEGTLPREAGDRLAGSYVNFYMANGGAVVPTFDDPQDAPALELLRKLMPERKIVGVPAREILLGGGNIHCITQQQPKP
ncbi:MAG: agmatine deiminase [Anaerolineaceae bacterium]